MRRLSGSNLATLAAAAAVASIFLIDLCNWVYDCGCRHLWAGADMYCNIHNPTGPHCPWCALSAAGQSALYLTVIGVQAAVVLGPRGWRWPLRLLAGLAAFPAVGWLLGMLLGWWTGYWDTAAIGSHH